MNQFLWGFGNFIMIILLLIVLLKSSDQITSNLNSLQMRLAVQDLLLDGCYSLNDESKGTTFLECREDKEVIYLRHPE